MASFSSETTGRDGIKEANTGDVEQLIFSDTHLMNTSVHYITWKGITVTVKDRNTKQSKNIVDNVEGLVEAGELCAIMGPSGCGKTTLLNVLAGRPTGARRIEGQVLVNGAKPSNAIFHRITSFVEQEDALIGSLTVRETLSFASRLASTSSLPKKQRIARIDSLLDAFGLWDQANTIIGTSIRKGISGGQKRRTGIASQLITGPNILFLDEPTSGLDSAASWEVMNYLKHVARRNRLIVIASIHQPSTSTFNLFDKVLLMSTGKTHYFGPVSDVTTHYQSLGYHVPYYINPAEFLLEILNVDFAQNRGGAAQILDEMQRVWSSSARAAYLSAVVTEAEARGTGEVQLDFAEKKPSSPSLVLTLLHRSFIKSYRDVVVYGIRLAMYTGLAIMMGTVWLRLSPEQASIIPLTNAIFYGSAFMSFMAVAYVPAFLEDRMQYIKEKQNGLYGATELMISNFVIGLPYLFIISIVFSIISYWLSNFQPTAPAFFTWVLWLYLDLLAAEGLVVVMTSLFPNFVIALALVAFANGLWMSVNGFMVQPTNMNVFYKYVFHYWDYQKYVFQNMMVNEFSERSYSCPQTPTGCQCMYQTDLADQCMIAGQGVLDQYGYKPGNTGKDIGIMISIIIGYRIAGWIVLKLRK
ncbi:P-loop containing nucleoside triphosphate hydrolase protein [Xylariales sp. PMI_506]|nr:P-loop containing nucleoside triphosphate hydrolase protein [Xylariales sp. PMI_506]